jgi:hypothetical protein
MLTSATRSGVIDPVVFVLSDIMFHSVTSGSISALSSRDTVGKATLTMACRYGRPQQGAPKGEHGQDTKL